MPRISVDGPPGGGHRDTRRSDAATSTTTGLDVAPSATPRPDQVSGAGPILGAGTPVRQDGDRPTAIIPRFRDVTPVSPGPPDSPTAPPDSPTAPPDRPTTPATGLTSASTVPTAPTEAARPAGWATGRDGAANRATPDGPGAGSRALEFPLEFRSPGRATGMPSTEPRAGQPEGAKTATPDVPLLKDDRTMIMPVAGDPIAETTLIPKVRLNEPPPDDDPEPVSTSTSRWGPRIVALRPLRSRDGYRSVHSDLTRTTRATVARTVARTLGEALITLGLVLLLFAGYEIWGKTMVVGSHQRGLEQQLAQDWNDPSTVSSSGSPSASAAAELGPPTGSAIARLYIPKLNKQLVVVEGVTQEDIKYAPGHYPNTALPGNPGNFSVAGHRIPAIFWDLDKLRYSATDPDYIIVETKTTWYVYEVMKVRIVSPTSWDVVAPVPDDPAAQPTREDKWLTMTTCNPKWDNYQRLVVHAKQISEQPRSAGRPKQLGG